ncbi:MAG: LysM peptidoglycan-binding domain-containing protein [Verrucomicrobiae bacterium]|nr:LysM peptidoglycan-binding domain-containing protein [Verrucomicrobiae bacterium]
MHSTRAAISKLLCSSSLTSPSTLLVTLLLTLISFTLLCGCASTASKKQEFSSTPNPDDEITAANYRTRPSPSTPAADPYAGTPYEGTASLDPAPTTNTENGTLPTDPGITYTPDAPTYAEDYTSGKYHTVVPGDTLWKIAREYNTTVRTLRALNGFTDPNTIIRPGDKIRLP